MFIQLLFLFDPPKEVASPTHTEIRGIPTIFRVSASVLLLSIAPSGWPQGVSTLVFQSKPFCMLFSLVDKFGTTALLNIYHCFHIHLTAVKCF